MPSNLISHVLFIIVFSGLVGFLFVFVLGNYIGIEKKIENVFRIGIVWFLIFAGNFILLPIIRNKF